MAKEIKEKNIKELIDRSGMITHYKVVSYLREKDWKVLVSPYYFDNTSDKIREIDIVAEKLIGIDESHCLCVQLFIECKYVNKEIFFWFDEKSLDNAVKRVENFFGLKLLGYNGDPAGDYKTEDLRYTRNSKVAITFSANSNNNDDIIFKALSQSLNSLIYYEGRGTAITQDGRSILHTIRIPVIACDNFKFLMDVNLASKESKEVDSNFLLEVNYSYLSNGVVVSDYFLIDVVDINNMQNFLNEVKNDADKIKQKLCRDLLKQYNDRYFN